ncbi:uncharacterized protein LOC141690431 [Apium graveolens]|uniref:uncharacterized protein LOC141690431 n=1 Tax=Apium graveolens TaxID=4045 RepID=UPI003D7A078E
MESQNSAPWWSLFVDGASNGDGAGAGIELISPEAHKIRRVTHLAFHATNNDAEYEALINGLKLALKMKMENLNVFSDSMSVVYQINGGQNKGADELAKLGSLREATLLGVLPLDIQRQPSMPEHEVGSLSDNLCPTWMIPILAYIKEGSLPDEKNEARRIKYNSPLCDIRWGPIQKRVQRAPPQPRGSPHIPHESLAFSMWGIDLIGVLLKAKGGVKYVVVAVDYFTKWAEAKPLATITFDSKEMLEFCEQLGIQKSFSAVCHPQSNGQTEAVNKIIKHTLKAKLEEIKGTWPKELAQVLWSYNTTPRTTTGETPFFLVYRCEAMVPVEVGAYSFRRDNYDSEANEVNYRLYLDMIEETREDAQIRIAAYQQRTARHYNSKVRARTFTVGDLVLRRVMSNTKVVSHGVFGANWEGPYKIKSVLWEGTYHLNDIQEKMIPRAWNTEHLRKYYH